MAKAELRLATFNLYNLQLPGQPLYRNTKPYTQSDYDRKVEWTAALLRELEADIIGFQELWSPKCLADVFREAGLKAQYQLVTDPAGPNGISVALAVRAPHKKTYSRWIKEFPNELVLKKRASTDPAEPDYEVSVDIRHFSRSVLRATIEPDMGAGKPSPPVAVFVAHLKSKLPMRLDKQEQAKPSVRQHYAAIGSALSTIRRAAESAGLRVILDKLMRDTDTPVVVLGDLNDAQNSVTTAIITGQPMYRLFYSSKTGYKSDRGLYSAATLQEYRSLRDVYYTHLHQGERESLDHILVSEQFYDYSNNRIWTFKEMRVINDYLDDEDRTTSDHGAVCATFVYDPPKKKP